MPPRSCHPAARGFTLIELLIVVAIIAILAAIAVPNFLEAQTRARVSRVQSDMRTQAISLEAYYIDNNVYPPDFSDVLAGKNPARYNTFAGRLTHLTTPVAYQTSLFRDIFADAAAAGSAVNYAGAPLSSAPYRVGGVLSGAIIEPITYDYAKFDPPGGPVPADTATVWARITSNVSAIQWALNSPGPDPNIHAYLGTPGIVVYDPTNGTISAGQIIRTNLGADDNPERN